VAYSFGAEDYKTNVVFISEFKTLIMWYNFKNNSSTLVRIRRVNTRGSFEKFVDGRQCAAIMQREHNSGALPPVHELFKRPAYNVLFTYLCSLVLPPPHTITDRRGTQ